MEMRMGPRPHVEGSHVTGDVVQVHEHGDYSVLGVDVVHMVHSQVRVPVLALGAWVGIPTWAFIQSCEISMTTLPQGRKWPVRGHRLLVCSHRWGDVPYTVHVRSWRAEQAHAHTYRAANSTRIALSPIIGASPPYTTRVAILRASTYKEVIGNG